MCREVKTVLVIGRTRSGTSAVAHLLDSIGVRMVLPGCERGGQLALSPKGDMEDMGMAEAITKWVKWAHLRRVPPQSRLSSPKVGRERAVREVSMVAQDRYQDRDIWGFKNTELHEPDILNVVLAAVPNPHLVYVIRNPVGTTLSYISSRILHGPQDSYSAAVFRAALKDTLRQYGRMRDLLEQYNGQCPQLVLQYEEIKASPRWWAGRIADWLGLRITDGQLHAVDSRVMGHTAGDDEAIERFKWCCQ